MLIGLDMHQAKITSQARNFLKNIKIDIVSWSTGPVYRLVTDALLYSVYDLFYFLLRPNYTSKILS